MCSASVLKWNAEVKSMNPAANTFVQILAFSLITWVTLESYLIFLYFGFSTCKADITAYDHPHSVVMGITWDNTCKFPKTRSGTQLILCSIVKQIDNISTFQSKSWINLVWQDVFGLTYMHLYFTLVLRITFCGESQYKFVNSKL